MTATARAKGNAGSPGIDIAARSGATAKPPGKEPTGKKLAGKKQTGKKPAGRKPTGRKPTGKRPTGKKPTGKKPAGKKPTGKKPTGKKPIGKKSIAGDAGSARDNFSPDVRTRLASRAGYRCSHPNCRVLTIGPSRESPVALASVGVAAHISAAAKDGPRWREEMAAEDRASIENGIWLCQTHARLIDRDVARFTEDTLRKMKTQHECFIEECIGLEEVRPAQVLLDGAPISDAAARILVARNPGWFHALLTQLLREEIASSRPSARALRFRVSTERPLLLSSDDLEAEIRTYVHGLSSLAVSLARLMSGEAMADALAPPGVESDPDTVAWIARSLGAVYRATLAAGSRWIVTECIDNDAMAQVIDLAPRLTEDLVRAVEEMPSLLDAASEEALRRVGDGERDVVVTVRKSIELPGVDDLVAAIRTARAARES